VDKVALGDRPKGTRRRLMATLLIAGGALVLAIAIAVIDPGGAIDGRMHLFACEMDGVVV
jgi:hypothetical protein